MDARYFAWLLSKIDCQEYDVDDYRYLIDTLFRISFRYSIENDDNRLADGLCLRSQYEYETGYVLRQNVKHIPCSVLEVVVALAIRCEEIMTDYRYGDRVPIWFWSMINSLGLIDQQDNVFDQVFVDVVVNKFLDREYANNGKGGLFTVSHPYESMREVEIWCQCQWFLDEVINNEKCNGL